MYETVLDVLDYAGTIGLLVLMFWMIGMIRGQLKDLKAGRRARSWPFRAINRIELGLVSMILVVEILKDSHWGWIAFWSVAVAYWGAWNVYDVIQIRRENKVDRQVRAILKHWN